MKPWPWLSRKPVTRADDKSGRLEAQPASSLITGDRLLLDEPPVEQSVISPRTWSENFIVSR